MSPLVAILPPLFLPFRRMPIAIVVATTVSADITIVATVTAVVVDVAVAIARVVASIGNSIFMRHTSDNGTAIHVILVGGHGIITPPLPLQAFRVHL